MSQPWIWAAANELNALEKQLGTLSKRMLTGVGVHFGKDSSEYEMAGGVRTSEIKRGCIAAEKFPGLFNKSLDLFRDKVNDGEFS